VNKEINKKKLIKQTKNAANLKENVVDCLCIGTSIIISLEAIHQSKLGKKVLMVDSSHSLGGAWKTIELDGIKNIENAIHYFTPNKKGISFLEKELKLPIEKSKGKFIYLRVFKNFYVRFLYDNLVIRLVNIIFSSSRPKYLIPSIKYFLRSICKVIKEPRNNSYYTAEGAIGIINNLKSLLRKNQIDVRFNSKINKIYFDLEKKVAHCQINNKKIICKSLILGHGARIPRIDHSKGVLILKEKFQPRPAYHLIVEDDKPTNIFEVIFANDSLIKYVHDVTRFSSLKNKPKNKRKVFVFALHTHVRDQRSLSDELFQKLKYIKLIEKNAKVRKSLFSNIHLPTLNDEDLYLLKENFGNLVSIFRTENLTNGISYYSEKWKSGS
jgi:hypothetical protein